MKQRTLETLEFIGAAIIIAEVLILAGLHICAHAGTYQELQAKYSNTVEVGIAPGETEAQESVVKISEEIPLGSFKLTAYCGCTKCCGKNAKKAQTASGSRSPGPASGRRRTTRSASTRR